MKLITSFLFSVFFLASFSQNLVFNKSLSGKYEAKRFNEKLDITVGSKDGQLEKGEVFRVKYTNNQEDKKELIFREAKGSVLGEWYKTMQGNMFMRFVKLRTGEIIAELGQDKNYDQIIDPYRKFKFLGDIEKVEVVLYENATNEAMINRSSEGASKAVNCDAEKKKLHEYFIENDEADVYEFGNQRLYVVSQIYGSHETMKGVLVEVEGDNSSITHKVDIWYQPNKGDYGCAFQIFDCKGKTELERYTVLVSEDKSMITLNGEGFKKVVK